MARPLRIEKAGGWYHVTARSNERKQIFRSDLDRRHFLDLLAEMVSRFRVRLHCFVLMENHYHLLLDEVGGLGGSGGIADYAVVATNVRRYEQRLPRSRPEQTRMKQVKQLLNCQK